LGHEETGLISSTHSHVLEKFLLSSCQNNQVGKCPKAKTEIHDKIHCVEITATGKVALKVLFSNTARFTKFTRRKVDAFHILVHFLLHVRLKEGKMETKKEKVQLESNEQFVQVVKFHFVRFVFFFPFSFVCSSFGMAYPRLKDKVTFM
jgi:hypothetical protein